MAARWKDWESDTSELCLQELHRDCRNPRATITHEYFPGSTFTFRNEPITRRCCKKHPKLEFAKCCNACGKDICGFSYRCEDDDLDLHPYCRNLPMTLTISDVVFNLKEKVASKCMGCNESRIPGGDKNTLGWSYVSACNRIHFHVYCMMKRVYEICTTTGEEVQLQQLAC